MKAVETKVNQKTSINMLKLSRTNMERTCNIDSRGRIVRFIIGIFAFFAGSIMALLINQGILISETYWIPVVGIIIGGIFTIWEAREGWCVIRAIGIRTPL